MQMPPKSQRGAPSRPHTPPITPEHKLKRRLSRDQSPASRASSIHPTETTSPDKKNEKRSVPDNIHVQELGDDDVENVSDGDVVHPEESEDASSDSSYDEDNDTASDVSDSETARITTKLFGLTCDPKQTAKFERAHKSRREKRRDSRVYKRSHSTSVKSEVGPVDAEAMDDQDCKAAARRLRRRTRGPADIVFEDIGQGLRESGISSGKDRTEPAQAAGKP